jgi:pimeloyl-ACP methyl ester carboxylesterase
MTCVDVDADLNIHKWDLTSALAALSVPTLVVEPEASPFGIEMSDAGAQALSHARLKKVVLPACGHFPWLECDEPFFSAVRAFLDDAQ